MKKDEEIFKVKDLPKIIKMFEDARDKHFNNYAQQPALFSHERQEYSGLDINTYIYVADNYKKLKEKLNGR